LIYCVAFVLQIYKDYSKLQIIQENKISYNIDIQQLLETIKE